MEQPISTATDSTAADSTAAESRARDELASRPAGTLMWVGDRRRAEFQQAYAYCEQHAAQLAPRRDVADALARPATAVDRVVIARPTRTEPARDLERQLAGRYPGASVVHLLGPLCAGESPSRLEPFGTSRIYWHQANQVLPIWFRADWADSLPAGSVPRSVAVIAATESAAEPLLDLAASAGATAVWCRRAEGFRFRNVDLVWWDDSAAPPVSVEAWRQRIASVAAATGGLQIGGNAGRVARPRPVRHAWLAGGPTVRQCRQAYEAGVQSVITKPAQIAPLLAMVSRSEEARRRVPVRSNAAPAAARAEQSVTRAA